MKNLIFKVSVVCSFPIVTAGIRLSSTCMLLMYPQLKLKWSLERTCYSLIKMRMLRLWNSIVQLNLVGSVSFHLAEIRFSVPTIGKGDRAGDVACSVPCCLGLPRQVSVSWCAILVFLAHFSWHWSCRWAPGVFGLVFFAYADVPRFHADIVLVVEKVRI